MKGETVFPAPRPPHIAPPPCGAATGHRCPLAPPLPRLPAEDSYCADSMSSLYFQWSSSGSSRAPSRLSRGAPAEAPPGSSDFPDGPRRAFCNARRYSYPEAVLRWLSSDRKDERSTVDVAGRVAGSVTGLHGMG